MASRALQMEHDRGACPVRVSRLDRLEDRNMLLLNGLRQWLMRECIVTSRMNGLAQLQIEIFQQCAVVRVMRRGGNRRVKCQIEFDACVEVLQVLLEIRKNIRQFYEITTRAAYRCQGGRCPF